MKKMYRDLINEIKNYSSDLEVVCEFEDRIIALNNPELSYLFAKEIGGNIKKHEDIVLKYGNERICYWFANGVKGADVKALEDKIYEGDNLSLMHDFSLFVVGADVLRYEKRILESKDAFYNYLFVKENGGLNIDEHQQIVIESGNLEYCFKFAKEIKGADILALGEVILSSKDLYYNLLFLDLPGSDKKAHLKVLLDGGVDLDILDIGTSLFENKKVKNLCKINSFFSMIKK